MSTLNLSHTEERQRGFIFRTVTAGLMIVESEPTIRAPTWYLYHVHGKADMRHSYNKQKLSSQVFHF